MRLFEIPGCRQSRHVEGMPFRDDEMRGFKNLCVYVHTALSGQADCVAQIVSTIDGSIYYQAHYNHRRWLMFFRGNRESLIET
ncbi:MAG: hypothetical protein ACP5SH_09325 [Syntrophobacteraceae bacterium]